jgi:hypothetical protein
MPTIHIAGHLGTPLEISDTFGGDFACVDLIGKVVKITHAAVNEVVFEVVPEGVSNGTLAPEGSSCTRLDESF